jgi:hypothetical protein
MRGPGGRDHHLEGGILGGVGGHVVGLVHLGEGERVGAYLLPRDTAAGHQPGHLGLSLAEPADVQKGRDAADHQQGGQEQRATTVASTPLFGFRYDPAQPAGT